MSAQAETASESLTSARFPLLLFFDGECAFCDQWINRIKDADHGRRLRFGTKQGATFKALAREHPEIAAVESIVLLKHRVNGPDEILVRSAAVREAIAGLPEFRFFAVVLKVAPEPLANIGYRMFSKVRTRIYGRLESCRVPRVEEKALFVA